MAPHHFPAEDSWRRARIVPGAHRPQIDGNDYSGDGRCTRLAGFDSRPAGSSLTPGLYRRWFDGGVAADTSDAQLARLARRIADLYESDQQFRDAKPLAAVSVAIRQPGLRLWQIVQVVMEGYAGRPALGQRAVEFATDPVTGRTAIRLLPRFEAITYSEVWRRVGAVASAWYHDSQHPVRTGDFIATLGFISVDYTIVDLACVRLGAVAVPLQTSAPVLQLKTIVEETRPRVLAASIDHLADAVELVSTGHAPERLIVFDFYPEVADHKEVFEAARRRLVAAGRPVLLEPLSEVVQQGTGLPPMPSPDTDGDSLVLLIYTSGSTGTPKGAIYTDRLVANWWSRPGKLPIIRVDFLPMSHGMGRGSLIQALANGGTSYFAAKSDLSTLFEDLALVRPTTLPFVPRLWDMLFQEYLGALDRRVAAGARPDAADREVKADLRQNVLGGRVLRAETGSALRSAEATVFGESCLDLKLLDGYGSTEAGNITRDNKVRRPPVIDYKLVDVPELGYFSTDKPYPRGELLVKSTTLVPGYYKQPELTAEVFTEDGYYKTGDIMVETGPDQLVYIDRRNSVLKLSQGEFVAISQLEAKLAGAPLVGQIYIYGNSERPYLLAVVVPTDDALARHGVAGVKTAISESLHKVANDAGLQSYEIPRDVLLETEPFTAENGLLSGSRKLLRPRLKERYGERLERLYAELARSQAAELYTLRHSNANRPVVETVSRAAAALLGTPTVELKPDAHFSDLGGDSLSALTFSSRLQEIFHVEVPVGVIVGAASDLRKIADYIETERRSTMRRLTAATVHGMNSTEIRAGDLTLEKFIDADVLAAAPGLPRPTAPAHTVLLTGANGYLGRFLALELLQRLVPTGGKVICIVRGRDAAAARKRVDDAFTGDPELTKRYQQLAANHLEVLAGDIAEPNLGVDRETWQRLAESVDLIVHAAALVNHVLPYNQLFGPNVVGTAELIRLALSRRMKPVNYISTMDVAQQVDPAAFTEDADIRVISPSRSTGSNYANGYANSKWASEVLLREAEDLCGLPVQVFRCDMILAHTRYTGQLNVADAFTRLLLSLITTGAAPKSFNKLDAQGNRRRTHYDGLPVDFIAEVLIAVAQQRTDGYHSYHICNPHDDGIGLDEFVDWFIEAGYRIERIDDYGKWFVRFETALQALPDDQKSRSLLPLLQAYKQPGTATEGSRHPGDRFQQALHAGVSPRDIPHLSKAFIQKYGDDLEQLGLTSRDSRRRHAVCRGPEGYFAGR